MKKISLSIIGLGIFVATIIIPMMAFGNESNVTGWAWAYMPDYNDEKFPPVNDRCKPVPDDIDKNREGCGQGLGWIKLNSTNYGVTLNSTTGLFGGYGWNSWGGGTGSYLNFSGARVDPACLASTASCPITGKIQFTNTGPGWDGLVSMQGTNYGVVLQSPDTNGVRKMTGYAWGDHVAGWIGFNATVTVTIPPVQCTNIPGWTSSSLPTVGAPNIIWTSDNNQCIPNACKDDKAKNYYAPNTVTVLETSLTIRSNNGLCDYDNSGGDDYCSNLKGIQTELPPNRGGVEWKSETSGPKKLCIPMVCKESFLIGTLYKGDPAPEGEVVYESNGKSCGTITVCEPPNEIDSQGKCCQPGRKNPITNICLPGYTVDEV